LNNRYVGEDRVHTHIKRKKLELKNSIKPVLKPYLRMRITKTEYIHT
jgi:hypothetical protein